MKLKTKIKIKLFVVLFALLILPTFCVNEHELPHWLDAMSGERYHSIQYQCEAGFVVDRDFVLQPDASLYQEKCN